LGTKLAQVALNFGADDLHGTILEEHIFRMAGAQSPAQQTEAEMVRAIRETGRTPVQRNTFYEPVKVWDTTPGQDDATAGSGADISGRNLATA
jgi:aminodeoxyfutalosine synthase